MLLGQAGLWRLDSISLKPIAWHCWRWNYISSWDYVSSSVHQPAIMNFIKSWQWCCDWWNFCRYWRCWEIPSQSCISMSCSSSIKFSLSMDRCVPFQISHFNAAVSIKANGELETDKMKKLSMGLESKHSSWFECSCWVRLRLPP